MKNFRLKNVILVFVSVLLVSACEKDDDPVNLESVTTMVAATSYTDWVYYSFSEGAEVTVTDAKTSTNWDIGLMRNHLRTNSGSSGNGAGGALDAGAVSFDSYLEAPETGYAVDDSIQHFDFATMSYISVAGNALLETWGEFTDAQPPTHIPTNNVFVVKTADGKYAKMMVQNYYGTDGSGYITFKYVYQPDGTAKF